MRQNIIDIYEESRNTYGYRCIYAVLKKQGICVSGKVVRRIMGDESLTGQLVEKRKYNSYLGEIGPAAQNIINRDFSADAPNQKW